MFWLEKFSKKNGNKNLNEIYLDYAASTPVAISVQKVLAQRYSQDVGNPYSNHVAGVKSKLIINDSLAKIAKILACPLNSLVVTSGATEANAIALQGVIDQAIHSQKFKNGNIKPHVIISAIEHPSVLGVHQYVDDKLIEIDVLPIDKNGIVVVKELTKLLRPETILVSVMLVNSEIGTIQPLNQLRKVINRYRKSNQAESSYPLLHSDASQAFLTQSIGLNKLHVDLLTLNGHKLYAPTGIGLLYVSPVIKDLVEPVFRSRYESKHLRPGTPPTALIAALSVAIELVDNNRARFIAKATLLNQRFLADLKMLGADLNGSTVQSGNRVPTNINVTFSNANHEFLQLQLDAAGIYCATRSACLERGGEGSVVLAALATDSNGLDSDAKSENALRFSFGYETTQAELDRVIIELEKALHIQKSGPSGSSK